MSRLAIAKAEVTLSWIHSDELPAVNVSSGKTRATWRIAPEAFEQFLAKR
jgi:hypothetical protein